MNRWLEFMGNHPFLFGILAVLAVLYFVIENKRSGAKITPQTLGLMVDNENAQLIDIRPTNKFAKGHIQNSRNISFDTLKEHLPQLRAETRPIILICEIGFQAGAAAALIGKDNVYRLSGGIEGYKAAGLPLVGQK